jgi:hypothetical protein
MTVSFVLPPQMQTALHDHLLRDRTREWFAVLLCGTHTTRDRLRLLGRHLILVPPEGYAHQSCCGLTLHQSVQRYIYQLAAREHLSQVDLHTHPGEHDQIAFSSTDDASEAANALYIHQKLPGTFYASIVLNARVSAARLWTVKRGIAVPLAIPTPEVQR